MLTTKDKVKAVALGATAGIVLGFCVNGRKQYIIHILDSIIKRSKKEELRI